MQAKIFWHFSSYRGADKSLAQPGRKQANVSVRMAWISFSTLPCRKKKLDDSARLDVVEIAHVCDMLPSFVSFLVGLRTYQHPGMSDTLVPVSCSWTFLGQQFKIDVSSQNTDTIGPLSPDSETLLPNKQPKMRYMCVQIYLCCNQT